MKTENRVLHCSILNKQKSRVKIQKLSKEKSKIRKFIENVCIVKNWSI